MYTARNTHYCHRVHVQSTTQFVYDLPHMICLMPDSSSFKRIRLEMNTRTPSGSRGLRKPACQPVSVKHNKLNLKTQTSTVSPCNRGHTHTAPPRGGGGGDLIARVQHKQFPTEFLSDVHRVRAPLRQGVNVCELQISTERMARGFGHARGSDSNSGRNRVPREIWPSLPPRLRLWSQDRYAVAFSPSRHAHADTHGPVRFRPPDPHPNPQPWLS